MDSCLNGNINCRLKSTHTVLYVSATVQSGPVSWIAQYEPAYIVLHKLHVFPGHPSLLQAHNICGVELIVC